MSSSETKYILNSEYTAIGTCGMTKDKLVKGKLAEINLAHNDAIIQDSTGRLCSVNPKTLKLV
jgi:hypothetical protein